MAGQMELFSTIHDKYYESTTDAFAIAYREETSLNPLDQLLDADVERVFELAAGDGFASRWLKNRRPHIQISGTDISEKAANDYRAKTGSECFVADFTKPFDVEQKVDAVIVMGGIHHFVADLDTAFENIRRMLKPNGILIMAEPNADYFLQPLRSLWYRLDRKNFDHATEWALSHNDLLKRYADHFVCESISYKGSPGALLMMHNWALRIPQSFKPWYARPVMAIDRAWHRLPGRLPFNFFVAKWRMIQPPVA